jgi:hypothetical protein
MGDDGACCGPAEPEFKRQLSRSDDRTQNLVRPLLSENPFRVERAPKETVAVWQAASFLARGREEGGGE